MGPWLDACVASMKSQRCFQEPQATTWAMYGLVTVQQYKPCKSFIDSSTALSKETVNVKSGVVEPDGERLHSRLIAFAESMCDVKDGLGFRNLGLWAVHLV